MFSTEVTISSLSLTRRFRVLPNKAAVLETATRCQWWSTNSLMGRTRPVVSFHSGSRWKAQSRWRAKGHTNLIYSHLIWSDSGWPRCHRSSDQEGSEVNPSESQPNQRGNPQVIGVVTGDPTRDEALMKCQSGLYGELAHWLSRRGWAVHWPE